MKNRLFIYFLMGIFSFNVTVPSFVRAGVAENIPSIAPLKEDPPLQEEQVIWLKDGEENHLSLPLFQGKEFGAIEQLAQISQSQIHWDQSSERVCLSRAEAEMCFYWNKNQVTGSKKSQVKKINLIYQESKLWVPLTFVASEEFSSFSRTEISWDARKKILMQETPVTLTIPVVENLGDRYRLRINVNSAMNYSLLQKDEKRIWLQFMRAKTEGSQILEGDTVIRDIRVNQKRNSADLFVNLGSNAQSTDIQLDTELSQIVIDVFLLKPTSMVAVTPSTKKEAVIRPKPVTKQLEVKKKIIYPTPVADKKVRTIMIDPGHGGIDCGAIGVRGTFEKDVNLKVAKELAEKLERQPNTRVILTRTKDEFVSLQERTQMANHAQADLFISVHCNSSLSASSKGFEVYVLSADASDEAAAAVARVENSVVNIETKNKSPNSKVNQLLASMAVANFMNESTRVASYICRSVKQKSSVKSAVIREANFFVLRGAQMPGVLLELEYLSNSSSESRLRSSRFISQLVKGIVDGVMSYDRLVRSRNVPSASDQRLAERREK